MKWMRLSNGLIHFAAVKTYMYFEICVMKPILLINSCVVYACE